MQVKEIKSEGLSRELEITVAATDIDKHIDDRLREVGQTVKLPGFRPGKVPLDILRQRYGKSVMGEVLEKAVNDSTSRVLQEKGLKPALQPKIEVTAFDEGKDLVYKMEVDILPEFEIMDLKKIEIEKQTAKPNKKVIDEALERIAGQNEESDPIKSDRAAKNGDIIVIDYHGKTKKDGKEHPGMHAHDHHLKLGTNQFIVGFEEQLVGKKKGEKVEVNVTFPDPYQMAELAGQEAVFDVEVKEIRTARPVEIDDDFAKKLGLENKKSLLDAITNQIQTEYDQLSRAKLKRALLDILDEKHEFEIPAGMQDLEFSSIRQQIAMERQDQLKDSELQLAKEEEEELQAIADRRVRLGLILSEIGQGNNIMVSDQELQRAVIVESQRYPGQEAEIFEHYRNNPQILEALRAPVFEDKVVDFILELATVTAKEVSVDDLIAEDDESYLDKKKGKDTKGKSSSAKKETGTKNGGGSTKKKTTAKKPSTAKKTTAKKKK